MCINKNEITTVLIFREKKWIDLGLSNSLRVHKWVPGKIERADC